MENVGIYTPPAANPVNTADILDSFSAELSQTDLEVTVSAQQKLAEIVSQSEDDVAGIRIYVGGGGCGGMTYGMTFTDDTSEFDTVLSFDTFKVLVDVVALNYLRGAQIDYIQEVGRERFVFNNVFAETGGSGTCGGCGSSGGGGGGCS
ncbi:MAG: iron-sulfur cluster assembly accessory protein [Gammaproteobacteria bacterium]|jgi:iron-sulfur cluster assembly accessory protein|nr:iron-sulfur cluster assembly accessory protein [Gammaproteobacteria bacterium]MBT3724819.1 iron-sulfur cluster assembly accessory protein [Gammaproteobacteria bacterium]MBT4075590.1 iron-sulfur cluster assembly accessory protein [Gammaproteobacteria bacterium]MBT4194878.1 iron-sulfur cluster assembly accessory protein [Gammaproteobacteria bacterium]MBT4448077.1 iron-sulfur cluster assembly accessory protein [Gammaproteobacteria bacterium]